MLSYSDTKRDELGSHDARHFHAVVRKAACSAIKEGSAAVARKLLHAHFPDLLSTELGQSAVMHLRCQEFTELVCSWSGSEFHFLFGTLMLAACQPLNALFLDVTES
jgi:hypothetical protein